MKRKMIEITVQKTLKNTEKTCSVCGKPISIYERFIDVRTLKAKTWRKTVFCLKCWSRNK